MQTKLIEIQAKTATVYFLGDIHEGAANHQAKALAKAIDIIALDSNAYWIGMGDYIDAINHRDPRFNPLVMGHIHKMQTDKAEFMSCDYNTIRIKRAWYGTNGCFLSKSEIGTDGYFEQKPGKPSDIGMLKYTIKTKIRDKSTATTSLEKIYL